MNNNSFMEINSEGREFVSWKEIKKSTFYSKLWSEELYVHYKTVGTRAEEAYFGDKTPLTETFMKNMPYLREIYDEAKIHKGKMSGNQQNEMYKRVQEHMKQFGKEIAACINAESVTIGLFYEMNAFALPMCYDSRLVDKKGVKASINEELLNSLEDIVETKDGFKFRDKKYKNFLLGMGFGLFDVMSDEEVTAVMLHELGHSFQHMLYTINGNVVATTRKQHLIAIKEMLDPIGSFLAFISKGDVANNVNLYFVYLIMVMIIKTIMGLAAVISETKLIMYLRKFGESETGKKIIIETFGNEGYSRLMFHKELTQMTRNTIKEMNDKNKWWMKVVFGVLGFIMQYLQMLGALYIPVNWITEGLGRAFALINYKFFKKEKRAEQFADAFASWYGYGHHLASGLRKMSKTDAIDLKSFNFLYYIPILNIYLTFFTMLEVRYQMLLHGYPTTKGRIEGIYTAMEFELRNNQDLTPNMKKKIEENMSEIQSEYNLFVFDIDGPNFVIGLLRRLNKNWVNIDKKSLDSKNPSDMVENVLMPLYLTSNELATEAEVAGKKSKKHDETKNNLIENLVKKGFFFDIFVFEKLSSAINKIIPNSIK